MHGISVTFISEYNQSYHTFHLVIKVYILLCVTIKNKKIGKKLPANKVFWSGCCLKKDKGKANNSYFRKVSKY